MSEGTVDLADVIMLMHAIVSDIVGYDEVIVDVRFAPARLHWSIDVRSSSGSHMQDYGETLGEALRRVVSVIKREAEERHAGDFLEITRKNLATLRESIARLEATRSEVE